jgi:hypothetical protein
VYKLLWSSCDQLSVVFCVHVSKYIPVTSCGFVQGGETSRIPHFLDSQLADGAQVFSLTCWLCFTHQEDFMVLISIRG